MERIRIGLIGAGRNTRDRHIPGFQAIEGVGIASVVNRSEASARAVAEAFGIPRVAESVAALLADPGIDAVCIGTWPNKHCEYTVAALQAGKHVLCEARMAMNAGEAEAMRAASAARPDRVAQIVPAPFDFRLGPTIARLVAEGALGRILEAHVVVLNGSGLDPQRALHWRHRRELSGNNVMTLGIYQEMLQRWLGPATRVVAHARVFVDRRVDPETGAETPVEIPDSLTVAADFECGARVTYALSAVAAGVPANDVLLFGDRATLAWHFGDTAEITPLGGAATPIEPDPGSDRGWRVEADFIDSIRQGTPVRLTNLRDGVRYMRFTDAVTQSWREGRAVDVAPLAD